MYQAIKVGTERILLNNVTNVATRTSDTLAKRDDGTLVELPFAREDCQTGLVATVYFVSNEQQDYVTFLGEEAADFLAQFDSMTGIVHIADVPTQIKAHITEATAEIISAMRQVTGEF